MKISLLLQREPFAEILEKTLASFLADYYQRPYQVKWYSRRSEISRIVKRGAQLWLCNPYLNAIFTATADPEVFAPVKSEFSTHPSPWRTHIQRVYVKLATGKALKRWFCSAAIGVSPPIPDAVNTLIVGGNHKIRIINHKTRTVYVILKKGFNPAYIGRELSIRKEYPDLPIPLIKETGKNGAWFSEEYINGTPVNRMKNKDLAASVVEQAAEALHGLLNATAREECVKDYADSLAVRVQADIKDNHLLKTEDKRLLLANVDELLNLIDKFAHSVDGVVTTAQTHGDFQPANILYDNGRVWLIDWEYSGRRQAGYDALVFSLQSRFPDGLAERMKAVLTSDFPVPKWLEKWTVSDWKRPNQRYLFLALFVLEELSFYLEENRNRQFRKLSQSFLQFYEELQSLTRIF